MGICLSSFVPASTWPPALPSRSPKRGVVALSAGSCLQKAVGSSASCPCTSSRLGFPVSGSSHALLRPGMLHGAPQHGTEQRLSVSILGGGPVGLTLALRLSEFTGGLRVSVTVYDRRWAKGSDGKFEWLPGQHGSDQFEESPVIVLPDDVVEPFSTSRLGNKSLMAFHGEHLWPHSRNLGAGRLREHLLQRIQEADLEDSITLAFGPPSHLWDALEHEPSDATVAACRGWMEALDGSPIIAADGPVGDLTRKAFAAELGWTPLISWHDDDANKVMHPVLDIIVEEAEVPSQSRLLSMAISGAQDRYFFTPDGKSRHAHLVVRLAEGESKLLAETFCPSRSSSSSGSRCMLYRRGSNDQEIGQLSRLYVLAPSLQEVLAQGVALFGFSETDIVSVALVATKPRSCIQAFVGSSSRGAKICSVVEDSGPCEQFQLPPQCFTGGHSRGIARRRSRGVAAGIEAAEALSRVLHTDAPPSSFECFMQGRRYVAGTAGWESLGTGPPAGEAGAMVQDEAAGSRQRLVDSIILWSTEIQKDPPFSASSVSIADIEAALERAGFATDFVVSTALFHGSGRSAGASAAESMALLRAGAECSPGVAFAFALQARAALEEEKPRQALALLCRPRGEKATEEAPPASIEDDLLASVVRAEAYLRIGRLEEASRHCEEALSADPEGAPALMVRAEVNLRMGYLVEAIQDCEFVIERDPGCIMAYAVRGEARLRLGRAEEAVMDCEWALAHGRRTAAVLSVRAEAHRKSGRIREAICDCDEALRESSGCAEALGIRGQARLELGDFSVAVADLSKALEAAKAASEAEASAAEAVGSSAHAETPSPPHSMEMTVPLLVARAEAQVNLRSFDEAIKDCDEALSLFRGEIALARAVRGEANLLGGRLQEAVTDCTVALSMEPSDAYTYAVRAQANMMLGHHLEAVRDCDEALKLCPKLEYAVSVRNKMRANVEE